MNLDELKEQWEELESWKKLLIVLFFSGVITYILYTFLLQNKINQKNSLSADIAKLKEEISLLRRMSNTKNEKKLKEKIDELRRLVKEKEREIKVYRRYIPTKPKSEEIFATVASKLSRYSVNMEKFKISGKSVIYAVYDKNLNRVIFKEKLSKKENGIKINKVSYEVSSVGTFKGLKKFLKSIKEEKRLILIDFIKLKKVKGVLKVDLGFSSYYMEEKN